MTNLPNPKAISLPAPLRGAGVWLVPAGSDKTPQRVWGWGVGLSPTTKLTLEVKWFFFFWFCFVCFLFFQLRKKPRISYTEKKTKPKHLLVNQIP